MTGIHPRHPDPLAQWAPRVVEAALDAIVAIDEAGRVVQFNRAAENMFGYRREEAIGRPLADLVIPEDLRARHWAGLLRLVAGEEPRILDRRLELRGLRRNGEEFPVELTVTQTSDSPLIWTAFIRDLTEPKAAEGEDGRRARLFEAAEKLALMGSWELDLHSNRVVWSDGMYRIHGFERTGFEPSVERYLELIHAEDRERAQGVLSSLMDAPGEAPADGVTVEYRIVWQDGALRNMRARGAVEMDGEGRAARLVGVAQDITAQRHAERELHAHAAVEQAFRDWETFDEGVTSLLRRLGTALEYELGSLWAWNDDDATLRCRSFWCGPGVDGGEFEVLTRIAALGSGEGMAGRAFETARPVLTEDLRSTDAGLGRGDAATRMGLRTGLAIPVVGHDGPLAVLSYYSFDRHDLTDRLVTTLTGIGSELGRFLERRRADLGPRPISRRELDVLRLAAEGNTGPQIAAQLSLSPATVKTHFENIYDKLGVGDRAAAVARAMRLGLIR